MFHVAFGVLLTVNVVLPVLRVFCRRLAFFLKLPRARERYLERVFDCTGPTGKLYVAVLMTRVIWSRVQGRYINFKYHIFKLEREDTTKIVYR